MGKFVGLHALTLKRRSQKASNHGVYTNTDPSINHTSYTSLDSAYMQE